MKKLDAKTLGAISGGTACPPCPPPAPPACPPPAPTYTPPSYSRGKSGCCW